MPHPESSLLLSFLPIYRKCAGEFHNIKGGEQNEKEKSQGKQETVNTTADWKGTGGTHKSQKSPGRPKDHGHLLTFSLLMLNLQLLLPTIFGDLTFCLVERRSIRHYVFF